MRPDDEAPSGDVPIGASPSPTAVADDTPFGPAHAEAWRATAGPRPGGEGEPAEPEVDEEERARFEQRRRTIRTIVDVLVVGACVVFALWHLQPHLLLRDTTPAGGDMGAHVWGPAYLRDHLLPNGQLAGWSGDWYAGFPAYQFYMVVPSLLIVGLNAGVHGWAALVPAAIGIGGLAWAVARWHDRRVRRWALVVAVLGFALVGLPYGVAFKLITVSGVATLPISAYVFGRLAGATFPSPAVLSVATLPFLFYRGFTIYGGNIPSTLAGEFAFSISLSLAVLYLGVVFKGLETGRYRALAAGLLALTGLCHIIPAFWAIGATVVAVAVRFNFTRSRIATGFPVLVGALGALTLGAGVVVALDGVVATVGMGLVALGAVALVAGLWLVSDSVRWLLPVGVVAGLLGAWWVGPFYLRSDYLNDMGWEKLPYEDAEMSRFAEWMQHLLPSKSADVDLKWIFALAVLGAALTIAMRMRLGIFLTLTTIGVGVVFVVIPEGRLWNGRLLPFYYLTTMMLAALAVTELARVIMLLVRDKRRQPAGAGVPVAAFVLAAVIVIVGVPLGQLPFTDKIENGHSWPRLSPWQVRAEPASFIPSWARWNYSGYEGKESYREYYDIVSRMRELGEQEGCGRAFWEYEKELDRYGTPMALMLLPHWTDGCIGSMEGLYFEASATTPFHFLTQVELSTSPSAAQRDLPYGGFDITKGVDHLQMMGVKYYMATSDNAISQARTSPDLTEVATSGPWVVFEVADSEVVSALENQPAVIDGLDHSQLEWVEEPHDESGRFGGPAVRWFTDPQRWAVPLASSGPEEWQRVEIGEEPEPEPLDPVEVSNIEVGEESISFDVDEVGVPVVVKMSYFPNWQVSGAEGPYRVAPNFMVVVPTETHVELTYGRTPVEYASYTATLLGIVGLVLQARRPQMVFSGRGARRRDDRIDGDGDGDGDDPGPYGDGDDDRGPYGQGAAESSLGGDGEAEAEAEAAEVAGHGGDGEADQEAPG
ncbi:MAG TPA: hypothetical protein VFY82_08185 [Acidimicrobiales bacterium]|nr:hypothetical protein [Acidimicrobiales bacterium]